MLGRTAERHLAADGHALTKLEAGDRLGRLADLSGLPVHEHVAVFEDVQRRLHETLADLAGQ